jgi:hypothetical protein
MFLLLLCFHLIEFDFVLLIEKQNLTTKYFQKEFSETQSVYAIER